MKSIEEMTADELFKLARDKADKEYELESRTIKTGQVNQDLFIIAEVIEGIENPYKLRTRDEFIALLNNLNPCIKCGSEINYSLYSGWTTGDGIILSPEEAARFVIQAPGE